MKNILQTLINHYFQWLESDASQSFILRIDRQLLRSASTPGKNKGPWSEGIIYHITNNHGLLLSFPATHQSNDNYTIVLSFRTVHNTTKRYMIPSNLQYKDHLIGKQNCWSLGCSWRIACRRCPNYIFILDLTPGIDGLDKGNWRRDDKHLSFVIWCGLY